MRDLIKTEIAKSDIEELKLHRERVAIEVMKLTKNRQTTDIVIERDGTHRP